MAKLAFILLTILLFHSTATGQEKPNKEKATEIAGRAIKIMDSGAIEESIKLLEEAQKLDKQNINYPYEIAYAYYKKEDYSKAITQLQQLTDRKDVIDEVYRLLGNAYDNAGLPEKALEAYSKGIELFPAKAGKFYVGSGLVEYHRENYNAAITFWENGIKAEPYYSSNYYWLCKIFSYTEENIWTLLYGEMFMNLEAGSKRTEEISNLLYKTYQKTYVKKSETEGEFYLTKNTTVYINPDDESVENPLNFELSYLLAYTAGADFTSGVNIKNIYEAKKHLLEFWFELKRLNHKYPNSLMEFEKQMLDNDYLEAYTYWFLSQGDYDEFLSWYNNNEVKFKNFLEWFKSNDIIIKKDALYSRQDYK